MNKIIAWVVEHMPLGKWVGKAQEVLDGKKQMLASIGTAVPATLLILKNFQEQGLAYLMGIAHTPEFLAAGAGWMGFFNALKGEKIRAEIAAAAPTPPAQ